MLITFTGRVDYGKAPLYLCAGDIALSPKISLTEANGKLFNYMACGLPAVVFDTPDQPGDHWVIPASMLRHGDPADFAARIEELLQNREQDAGTRRQGEGKGRREHSWRSRGEELGRHLPGIAKTGP